MSDSWIYEPTTDGWEIRDENRLLVALVPDPQHEREEDARRMARSLDLGQRPALPQNSTCVFSQAASSCAEPQLTPEEDMVYRRELNPPPIAISHPNSVEVLRAWADPDGLQQVTLITEWEDPGVWGLMLADIARHLAEAYARRGVNRKLALSRIKELFDAEWSGPTTRIKDLSDGA